jgi:hypothetical protein
MDPYVLSALISAIAVVVGIYCGSSKWFDKIMRNIGELLLKK